MPESAIDPVRSVRLCNLEPRPRSHIDQASWRAHGPLPGGPARDLRSAEAPVADMGCDVRSVANKR